MADTTNLEIVTPSMVIVSEPVEMVVVPGSDGQIGALPRHSQVMSTLERGIVDIYNDNKISSRVMIDGGIAEINPTSVVILAERAEKLDKTNKHILNEKLLAFQTSIVIAHRLETVLNAEKIMVMENGNLIGFDSHKNLLKSNQTYTDLFSAWNLVNDL